MSPLGDSSEASKTALSDSLPFKPLALPGVPDLCIILIQDSVIE